MTPRTLIHHPGAPAAAGFLTVLPLAIGLAGLGGVLLYGAILGWTVALSLGVYGLAVLTDKVAGR